MGDCEIRSLIGSNCTQRPFGLYLQREAIVGVSNRTPEGDSTNIRHQYLDGEPFCFGPDVRSEIFYQSPANRLATAATSHKKLSEVNLVRLFSEQSI